MKGNVLIEDVFTNEEKESLFELVKSMNSKSVLITGSNGFIGSTLVLALTNAMSEGILDCELFLASRSWQEHSEYESLRNVHLISNEVARSKKFEYDVIFHTASPSNITKITTIDELRDINTRYLSDCVSSKTKNIIYLSSGEVYGGASTSIESKLEKPKTESRRGWYPLAKIETEEFLAGMSSGTDLTIGIVRLFHTFGPGLKVDDGRSFADIIWGAVNSRKITLKSDGQQVRSFLYIGDAISALLMLANSSVGVTILNIGNDQPLTVRQFAELVGEISQSALVFATQEFEHSPYSSIIPDISESETIGWRPLVQVDDAITRTLNWAKS